MEEWKKYKMSDFIDFNPTISLKKGTVARKITMDKLIPHSRDIYDWEYEPYSGGSKFQNGDTIMARITPCLENGKHAFISLLNDGEIAYGSTEYIVMRGIPGISDNRFVYYLSHFPDFKNAAVKSMVGSSGRQRAQVDVLKNLEFYLPGLKEQRKIADTLSALDDKIALNNRINHNLEEQAQALYKSWFVDFEPFKDGKFVYSELGLIPEGWHIKRAEELCQINIGKTPPRKETHWFSLENNEPVWVSISDMSDCGVFIHDSAEKLTKEALKKFNILLVPEGSVLLSFKLTIGRVAIANRELTTNEAIARFITNDKALALYLYLTLKQYDYSKLGSTSSIATAVNSKIVKAMPVLWPGYNVISAFSESIGASFIEIKKRQAENRCLTSLRDSLLPELMSGKMPN